jgi:hypothetical protein
VKLRPEHERSLFEVRPEIFQPCPVGVGVWSFVAPDLIDEDEVEALVSEAWSTVEAKRRWTTGEAAVADSKFCDWGAGEKGRGPCPSSIA